MADMESGHVFGERFEIAGVLGRGGTATVYLALDRVRQEQVALKVLHDHLASSASMRERLRLEVTMASHFRHPNALTAHELHESDGNLAVSMPVHRGDSLAQHVERHGPLPESQLADLARTLCDVLADAHRLGLVHRDVTPSNVLIDGEGALLTDFGLARLIDQHTATTQALGTAGYAAVEIYDGVRADPRSDVYSLGAVLYFAATGRAPFSGATAMASLQKQLAEDYPPITEHRPDLQPYITATIESMLSKQRQARPELASVQEALRTSHAPAASRSAQRGAPSSVQRGMAWSTLSLAGLSLFQDVGAFVLSRIIDGQTVPEPGVVAMTQGIALVLGLPLCLIPTLVGGLRSTDPTPAGPRSWAALASMAMFVVVYGVIAALIRPNWGGPEDTVTMATIGVHLALLVPLTLTMLWAVLRHLRPREQALESGPTQDSLARRALGELAALEATVDRNRTEPAVRADIQRLVRQLNGRVAELDADVERTSEQLTRLDVEHSTAELDRISEKLERLQTLGGDGAERAELEKAQQTHREALAYASQLETHITRTTARLLEIVAVAVQTRRQLDRSEMDQPLTGILARLEQSTAQAMAARAEVQSDTPAPRQDARVAIKHNDGGP